MKPSLWPRLKESLALRLNSPTDMFILTALFFGMLFVFLTPPMQAPDEHHHFFRAYQVSTHDFIPDIFHINGDSGVGGVIPNNVKLAGYDLLGDLPSKPQNKASLPLIAKYWRMPLNSRDVSTAHFEPAASSSFLPYLPQAFGIKIATLLSGTVLQIFYAGRLVNFLIWLTLSFFAIKLIPFGKWVYVLLLLSPVIVFQAASLSPDAVTNALSFLYVALVLRLANLKKALRWYDIALILAIAGALALCKQAYFIIGLFGLIIPARRFKVRWRYLAYLVAVILCSVGLTALWALAARNFLPYLIANFLPGQDVSANAQIRFIVFHPIGFGLAFIHTFFTQFCDYIVLEYNGRVGWSDVHLPVWVSVVEYLLLATVIVASSSGVATKLRRWQQWIGYSLVALTVMALATVVYLSWTPVGGSYILGLQGRYFIPVVALLAPLLIPPAPKVHWSERRVAHVIAIFTPAVMLLTLTLLVSRYYF